MPPQEKPPPDCLQPDPDRHSQTSLMTGGAETTSADMHINVVHRLLSVQVSSEVSATNEAPTPQPMTHLNESSFVGFYC